MIFKETNLDGVFLIENFLARDERGYFLKLYNHEEFDRHNLRMQFEEINYSYSVKNTIRGMHYQISPYDHAKLIRVVSGEILDVAVDIRKDSKTFGEYFKTKLFGEDKMAVYIGKGFAHGFLVLSKDAIMLYATTKVHSKEHDTGIMWNSFGFDWGIANPILSDRDKNLPLLSELK